MLMDMRRKPISQKAGREQDKRGFTLTEIAIVLGIIGLILGAIWVAAAAVYNNMRTSKTTTELLDVAQNLRAMYATAGTVDPLANTPAGFAAAAAGNANQTYMLANIFPADTLNATQTLAQNPWNGGIGIQAETVTTANDSFMIAFDNVPEGPCITVITATTGTGRDPGLSGVNVAATGAIPAYAAPAGGFPITASQAQALCNNAFQALGFTFKLK